MQNIAISEALAAMKNLPGMATYAARHEHYACKSKTWLAGTSPGEPGRDGSGQEPEIIS